MAMNKNISMTIASKTLSDSFSLQTYDAAEIDQIFTVAIKGANYTFKAAAISNSNNLNNVSGVYDIDDILNKGMHNIFNPPIDAINVKAINTMQAISLLLGKTLNINITDFYPAEYPTAPTGKELISALFGWTDKIPQKQVNVFIRGNIINVLERGKETETVEVLKYANVSSNKKKIRTLQDAVDVEGTTMTGVLAGEMPQQYAPHYISGIFVNGGSSITYSNGLVTKEIHTVGGNEEITTYQYSSSMPPAFLSSKNTASTTVEGTVTKHVSVNVSYDYSNDKLCTETEKHYTDDVLDMTRITRHYPIGQGMWGTSVEEDDVTTYGGISQGAPGGKASGYSIAQNSANPDTSPNREPPVCFLPGKPYTKYLGTMPVTDIASITRIANEIIWLDKKTEFKVSLDAYADTIFDLTKKILWNGNEYFLESNNVKVDADKTVQKLELIRWA